MGIGMSDRITLPLYQVGWSSEAPLADKGAGHLLSCKNYVIKQNLLDSRKGCLPISFVDGGGDPLTFSKPIKTLIPLQEYNMLIVASDDTIYVFEKVAGVYTLQKSLGGFSGSEWRWAYMNHQIIMVNGLDNAQQIFVTDYGLVTQDVTIQDWAVTDAPSKVFDWVAVLNAQVAAGYGNDLSAWYLPVGYVQGAMKEFDIGQSAGTPKKGGSIIGGFNINRDAGMSLNAYIGFITNQGEAIVYTGNDLDDPSNIVFNGVYQTGYPLGKTPFINWSGDLIIMTNKGFISAHSIFANGENQNGQFIFSQRINTWLLDQATKFGTYSGFMGLVVPNEDFVLFNIPQGGETFVQCCMNITSGKWSMFTDINAYTMCVADGKLLFGMADHVAEYTESASDPSVIPLEIWTSYTNCGSDLLKRLNFIQIRHASSDKVNLGFSVYKDFENQAYYNWVDTSDVPESIGESGFYWSNDPNANDPTPGTAQWDIIPVDTVATYSDLTGYDTSGLQEDDVISVESDSNHDNEQSYYKWSGGTWVYIGSVLESEYWSGGFDNLTASADTYSASGLGHNFSIKIVTKVKGIKHQVVDLMLLFNTSKTAI
jgi:hypothetical protein